MKDGPSESIRYAILEPIRDLSHDEFGTDRQLHEASQTENGTGAEINSECERLPSSVHGDVCGGNSIDKKQTGADGWFRGVYYGKIIDNDDDVYEHSYKKCDKI